MYVYEVKEVQKGRSTKFCDNEGCGNSIPVGTSHFVLTCVDGEFYNMAACSKECVEAIEATADE